ncbi:hypothetical protein PBI_SCTP2_13 [Salicola phage SCTP-2]|nr:hypothetical protein PBI_SCTP2_13 [Salicola phage SCTP-2]
MTQNIDRSVASHTEEIVGNLQFFTLYTTVDITTTGNYQDTSQKVFDNIITLISTRAQPVVIGEPYNVSQLENEGAPSLTGTGYVFKFVVEHSDVFASVDDDYNIDDPVYHLKYIFNDITVDGQTFYTEGGSLNIEFKINQQI